MAKNSGTVFDLIAIILVLFIGVIGFYLAYLILNNFINMGLLSGNANSTACLTYGLNAVKALDYTGLLVFFGLSFVAVLFAFQVRSHPGFFLITWFALLIVILFSIIFANVFYNFATHPALVDAANQYPLIYALFSNLPLICLFLSAIIAIVIHSRSAGEVY